MPNMAEPLGRGLIGWSFGELCEGKRFKSTAADVDRACKLAGSAFKAYSSLPAARRAAFLERCALEIEALGDTLIQTCSRETSLPPVRISNERERTCGQLRIFAKLLHEGSWVRARLDVDGTKDLRLMQIPIGPVGVFAASNFPLAFSAAGGDTASALAAGCPVVMKAHAAHPETSELVGRAVLRAARACGMPEGVYSMVYGRIGLDLVNHPAIKAIGFTGSYAGGRLFADTAAKRPEPIPVFAEMGSVNPVFVLPEAIKGDAAVSVATTLAASITMGAGQFCTNPGAIVVGESKDADIFLATLAEKIAATPTQGMLTTGIRDAYRHGVDHMVKLGARVVASGAGDDPARPCLLSADAAALLAEPKLAEEVFGPCSCVYIAKSREMMMEVAASMVGQLTATVWHAGGDLALHPELVPLVSAKVGRVVFNGVSTGVAVCDAMQHGGPFPASTDARFTSVGTAAIDRFIRPVCYQDMPPELQPAELQDENPLGIVRIVNGVGTRAAVSEVVFPMSRL